MVASVTLAHDRPWLTVLSRCSRSRSVLWPGEAQQKSEESDARRRVEAARNAVDEKATVVLLRQNVRAVPAVNPWVEVRSESS